MRDGRMDVFAAGRYRDQVREEDGVVRFKERVVICDSSHFDTLVAEGMSTTQLRDVGRIAAVINATAQCIAAEGK